MNVQIKTPILTALVVLLALTGCASRKARVNSAADLTYTKAVHRLFVLAEMPRASQGEFLYLWGESTLVDRNDPERKKKLYQTYKDTIEAEYKKIGIEARCYVPTGLELEDLSLEDQAAAFKADAVLVADCIEIQLRNGNPVSSTFDVSILDYPSMKRVWRGKLGINHMFSPYVDVTGRKIVATVSKMLKNDNMNIMGTIEEDK